MLFFIFENEKDCGAFTGLIDFNSIRFAANLFLTEYILLCTSQTSPSTPSAATPERTLSRKSSTLSSDSGSTTFSKSTDPSSAGSSPFHPTGAPKSAQPSPSQLQAQHQQQQQQQQQQRRQGSFDNAMGLTPNNHNNNYSQPVLGGRTFAATPAATETSDPFSLMTNAFGNMGMNISRSAGINSNDAFSTQLNGGYTGQSAFSQAQAPSSQAHSSNDFFSTFSQPSPSATLQGSTNSDPFSLASSGQTQSHQSQYKQYQPYTNQGAFQGLDFGGGASSSAEIAAGAGAGTGMMGGAKSFDDYLSVLGQGQQQQQSHLQAAASSNGSIFNSPSSAFSVAASSKTTLSPQSTGSVNPFGLQQQQPPQQLQRAFTADYISTTTGYNGNGAVSAGPASSGQQSNPFAMFAKHNQPQPSSSDPFGNMTVPQQYQQQQQQQQQPDYFSTAGVSSSGTRSPNPFAMASGGQQHAQSTAPSSPFSQPQQQFNQYQQQQQAAQPAFMRSASESSYNFQDAFSGSTAGPSSSSIYESAFSMPGAPTRSMTVPATINNSGAGGAGGAGNMNDMFGQWMKPSPVAATSKYPSIDDLDPFSATLSSASSGAVPVSGNSASAYSNPFSLNM